MITDILSSISVILVFVFVLVDIINARTNKFVDMNKPRKTEDSSFSDFKRLYEYNMILLIFSFILSSFIFYMLLPTCVEIIRFGRLELWNFDPLNTSFILIEFCFLLTIVYILYLIIKMIKKFH